MEITSLAFANNQYIPAKYTCDGENKNPPLEISGVPEQTQSLVLTVDDPDAPSGDFVHWTIWNLNPDTKEIIEGGILPAGSVQGMTDFGRSGYGGPCPPSGVHRYFFKLYALDRTLDIPRSSTKKELEKAMAGHIITQSQLIGLYARSK
jgi:Raf kinase inhibitor-like YbhB/YbcL family protein